MKHNYSQIKTSRFLVIEKRSPRSPLSNNSRRRRCFIMAVQVDKRASNYSKRPIGLSNQVSSEIRVKRVRLRHITKTNSYLQIVSKAHSPIIDIYSQNQALVTVLNKENRRRKNNYTNWGLDRIQIRSVGSFCSQQDMASRLIPYFSMINKHPRERFTTIRWQAASQIRMSFRVMNRHQDC